MTQRTDLVLLVAAAGFGKSTALDAARPRDGMVRSATEALDEGLPVRDWIGIDDLHELLPAQQLRLIAEISALPRTTHVMMTSRRPLDPDVRRRLRGRVRERGPDDLALSPYAVHRVLVDEYGVVDPEVPIEVHALTAGWPALVHFAADALARNPDVDLRAALIAPATPALYWLREEVFPTITQGSQRMLAVLSGLGPTTRNVCRRMADVVGLAGQEWPIDDLEGSGILTALHGVGREGLVEVVPMVAGALAAAGGQQPGESCWRELARVMEEGDLPFAAALASVRAGDWPGSLRLMADRGAEMLSSGEAAGVVQLVESAPSGELPERVRHTYADALRICGDLPGAARAFRPLVAAAEAQDGGGVSRHSWSPALASGVAAMHYAGGRLDTALDVLARADGSLTAGEPALGRIGAEAVEWISSRVHVLCSLGRTEQARRVAGEALERAEATGDARALTAAHLAMARVSAGERKEAHHEYALNAATECRDVITAARILVNQSCQFLASARYVEGSLAARSAIQAADIGIATGRRAAALHNLAEALGQQGEYDEASWHLHRAIALCRHLGIGRTALGLLGLAEISRQLGHDQPARARYLEAVELARGSREAQVLVPALAGLARSYAVAQDDHPAGLDLAQTAADEAMEVATPPLRPFALTAAGWVALRTNERAGALALARQSEATAREMQAFDLLAEALELGAACVDQAEDARRMLAEAHSIWEGGGAHPAARRVELQLGRLEGADSTARSRARDAARELQRLGVRHVNGLALSTAGTAASVAIAVLGGFAVSVDRAEVPGPAWRSRQARTLVKILAARRGRAATRAWLCETIWPDDDPAKTGHRLSVLLATVRGVLDPERRWPTDRFISADSGGVWLDLRHVTLDAETLIRDAEAAAGLMDSGQVARAAEILADIDARYRGEAFEDEPGEEWADGVREEVRAAWQRSARRLAALRRRAGRLGDAQTLLVRLLAADPYDDKIHQLLVKNLLSAGRHGEAQRAFQRWSEAMHDIGAPQPDPLILGRRPGDTPAPGDSAPSQGVRLTSVVTAY